MTQRTQAGMSPQEINYYRGVLNSLRLSDLQSVMNVGQLNKNGKKAELVHRAMEALTGPKTAEQQTNMIAKIREFQARTTQGNRYFSGNQPSSNGVPNYSIGGMGGSYYQSVPTTPVTTVNGLNVVPLPFFDRFECLTEPSELQASQTGQKTPAKANVSLVLPMRTANNINYKSDSCPLPRYELQLRFFCLGEGGDSWRTTPQPDDFPPSCAVRIDDILVPLPPVIPTNRPNVEAKRPSRPVNITPVIQQLGISASKQYRLTIDWFADKRRWAFSVHSVLRITTQTLIERLKARADAMQPMHITKDTIIRRLGTGDDDGIAMEQLSTSLRCPLLRTRLKTPSKCRDCTHLQCFDLTNYISMNEKRPTWKCPVCSGPAPYDRLIVDSYFVHVLKEVPADVEEVELLRDGGWRILTQEELTLSDTDAEQDVKPFKKDLLKEVSPAAQVQAPVRVPSEPRVGPPPAKKRFQEAEAEVITLDDSDDEDTQKAVAASLSHAHLRDRSTTSSGSTPEPSSSGGGAENESSQPQTPPTPPPNNTCKHIEVITLDDTPPREQRSAAVTTAAAAITATVTASTSTTSTSTTNGFPSTLPAHPFQLQAPNTNLANVLQSHLRNGNSFSQMSNSATSPNGALLAGEHPSELFSQYFRFPMHDGQQMYSAPGSGPFAQHSFAQGFPQLRGVNFGPYQNMMNWMHQAQVQANGQQGLTSTSQPSTPSSIGSGGAYSGVPSSGTPPIVGHVSSPDENYSDRLRNVLESFSNGSANGPLNGRPQ